MFQKHYMRSALLKLHITYQHMKENTQAKIFVKLCIVRFFKLICQANHTTFFFKVSVCISISYSSLVVSETLIKLVYITRIRYWLL